MTKKNGYEGLAGAVIEQAKKDYVRTKLLLEKTFDELQELQDFFEDKDGMYSFYSQDDDGASGIAIMKSLDEKVEKRLEKWRKKREESAA